MEVVEAATVEQRLGLCVTLSCTVNALMRRMLSQSEGLGDRREKIAQLTQTVGQLVNLMQELTRQHADLQGMKKLDRRLNGTVSLIGYLCDWVIGSSLLMGMSCG